MPYQMVCNTKEVFYKSSSVRDIHSMHMNAKYPTACSIGLPHTFELSRKLLKLAIWSTIKEMFGIIGGEKMVFDLIHLEKHDCILRTSSE